MTINKQDVENLVAIGLTNTQAKVYLTLVRFGMAKAKTIWKDSGVARQDIYRILTELEEKSLVEKIVAAPTEFRAIPLQDGLRTIMKEETHQYNELRKKTSELFERLTINQKESAPINESEFIIISTKDAYMRRLEDAVTATQKSIDIINSFDEFRYRVGNDTELIEKLIGKNVRMRYILNHPKDGQSLPKVFTLRKNSCVEIRFIPTEPLATIRIEDKKQVFISASTATDKQYVKPRLFSNSPYLVTVLQDYFERIWPKQLKPPYKFYFNIKCQL